MEGETAAPSAHPVRGEQRPARQDATTRCEDAHARWDCSPQPQAKRCNAGSSGTSATAALGRLNHQNRYPLLPVPVTERRCDFADGTVAVSCLPRWSMQYPCPSALRPTRSTNQRAPRAQGFPARLPDATSIRRVDHRKNAGDRFRDDSRRRAPAKPTLRAFAPSVCVASRAPHKSATVLATLGVRTPCAHTHTRGRLLTGVCARGARLLGSGVVVGDDESGSVLAVFDGGECGRVVGVCVMRAHVSAGPRLQSGACVVSRSLAMRSSVRGRRAGPVCE